MSSAPYEEQSVIGIAAGFRFQWEQAQDTYVLLYPEGMVKLSESASEILKRCDGTKTFSGIVDDLKTQFPGADLEDDVKQFVEHAFEKGWLAAT